MVTDLPHAQAWEGRDEVLDRAVRVTIVTGGPVPTALDAARRAALVADPRLVRIQDVGETDGVGYIICEDVHGPNLAELVDRGPLVASQARALIGEAAAALETARRRGVHHLALRPSALHCTPDGRVLLTGAALDGVLTENAAGDARSTSRTDAVGLVAMLYFALTGRWPGAELPGLPPAPRAGGVPVPPSELVPGVPNDLDTLCAVTFGPHDDGPHSPGELVRDLAPWPAISLGRLLDPQPPAEADDDLAESTAMMDVNEIFATDDAGAASALPGAGDGGMPRRVSRQSVRAALDTPTTRTDRPGTPPPAAPTRRPALPHPVPPTPPPAGIGAPVLATLGLGAAGPSGEGAGAGAGGIAGGIGGGIGGARTVRSGPAMSGGSVPPVPPPSPVPPVFQPVAAPAGPLPRFAEREPLPPRTRRFDPTRVVLLIAAAALLLGLVVALKTFFAPTTPPVTAGSTSSQAPSSTASGAPSASPSDSGAPSGTPSGSPSASTPGAPIALSGAQSLDPPPAGDNNEHPELVPRAIDGDPATFWYSRTYKNVKMPGKPGIGFAVTLAQSSMVSTVTLHVNGTGGHVDVRATDPSAPMTGEILAQGAFGPDVTLTFAQPVQAQSIVLWVTELPVTPEGKNRIELTEIQVS